MCEDRKPGVEDKVGKGTMPSGLRKEKGRVTPGHKVTGGCVRCTNNRKVEEKKIPVTLKSQTARGTEGPASAPACVQ